MGTPSARTIAPAAASARAFRTAWAAHPAGATVYAPVMGEADRLRKGEWEAILHAPFHVYTVVASADGEPMAAQFRALRDRLEQGPGAFPEGSVGRTMVDTLGLNIDALWAGYQATGRSPKDGLGRARKALGRIPDEASAGVRDWLVELAGHIAAARRTIGEDSVSEAERQAVRDVAAWLDRPLPASPAD